jgi:tetratricopeptide (TPR) repeat protein/transcriptional regulator with XRE-family HTH domain
MADGMRSAAPADIPLGDLLRQLRNRQLLTQEEVAERAGLSVGTVGGLESGRINRPRSASVRALADLLASTDEERRQLIAAASGDVARKAGPKFAAASPVPAQLPADVRGFAGREEHLCWLHALLSEASEGSSTAVVISAMSGTAGVGKTALAVHWAHGVRDQFPDGQLYVNLRGFDPTGRPMAPVEAVRGFLDALGVATERIPAGLDAQTALYRSLLADKRVLVVLDNARDVDQVRPLLPGTSPAMVVVTSRNNLTPLIANEGAYPLLLDVLSMQEARDLLSRRLGERVAAEPAAVDLIIAACARLPLALAVVAAHATTQPHFPLTVLADELRDTHHPLRMLTVDPAMDMQAIFSWSYRALTAEAAQLFRLLGLHPGPDVSVAAAASLAGIDQAVVRPLLAELSCAHLLIEHVAGRYTFHDLLRAYAADLTDLEDTKEARAGAIRRLLDHYLHTAQAADQLLNPTREPMNLAQAAPGVTPEQIADQAHALTWFSSERPALLAAVELAARTDHDTQAWQLAWGLTAFLRRRGRWREQATAHETGLKAAERLCDLATQARLHRGIARAYSVLGRFAAAHAHLRNAFHIDDQTGDRVSRARSHLDLAWTWAAQELYEEALREAEAAFDLYAAGDHRRGQAHTLNTIGWYHTQLGNYQTGLDRCQQALALLQAIGDPDGEAHTWDSIGFAHHHLGNHDRAITCYQQAIATFRAFGDQSEEATTLIHLGDTHHAVGDLTAARAAWRQARQILRQIDDPGAERLDAKLQALDNRHR